MRALAETMSIVECTRKKEMSLVARMSESQKPMAKSRIQGLALALGLEQGKLETPFSREQLNQLQVFSKSLTGIEAQGFYKSIHCGPS
jgi:hypothetical protein